MCVCVCVCACVRACVNITSDLHKEGTVHRTQTLVCLPSPPQSYLESMEENLREFLGLLSPDHLARKGFSPSYVFKRMSNAEPNNTYVKDATANLGAICETLERSQV